MRVRVWDDDVNSEDDAIGSTVVALELPGGTVDKAVCKGREQAGTGGYVLPDFQVSFTYSIA